MMEFRETQQLEIDDVPQPVSSHMNVKKVIGILSSKGGVGKSSLTGLLAVELSRRGFQVGILDADLTCPSISMLFGVYGPVKTVRWTPSNEIWDQDNFAQPAR